jgi:hypothetical protein
MQITLLLYLNKCVSRVRCTFATEENRSAMRQLQDHTQTANSICLYVDIMYTASVHSALKVWRTLTPLNAFIDMLYRRSLSID